MKQFGIEINHVVETDMLLEKFTDKFIAWVEENGWTTGGTMRAVDDDGNPIRKEASNE
jgi:hypothetical protein